MMRAEAVGPSGSFLEILLELRTGSSCLATSENFSASETWAFWLDGARRLRRTDLRSTRVPGVEEKLSGKMGSSTRSCHGEAGEACGTGVVWAILSLETERPAPGGRPLASWGVAISALTATDSGFLGVASSSEDSMAWGAGDRALADWHCLRCSSALRRSLAMISTTGIKGTVWERPAPGFGVWVGVVGDSGMGAGVVAEAAAAVAAAVARVTRRRTGLSPAAVDSFSTLSLLRSCRESRWLLRFFLRDNLPEAEEQKLRRPGWAGLGERGEDGGGHPKF